jgi:hypothetical protein
MTHATRVAAVAVLAASRIATNISRGRGTLGGRCSFGPVYGPCTLPADQILVKHSHKEEFTMRYIVSRCCLLLFLTVFVVQTLAADAEAQGRTMGQVTDEWGNELEGASILAEPEDAPGGAQDTTTDDDGEFLFVGLARGRWSFTATMDGYQGLRQITNISQLNSNRPIEFELPALASGGRFRERTEFEAEGGLPKFRFEEDGAFEFEDADGEGKGTYGIVEESAVLVVREYDGADDKFSVATPVIVQFGDSMFTSLTHDGVELPKK